jgi:hypothetical protein
MIVRPALKGRGYHGLRARDKPQAGEPTRRHFVQVMVNRWTQCLSEG